MRWIRGKTYTKKYPKTASETFTIGEIVMLVSGYVTAATAQSTRHLGLVLEAVASTDASLASMTDIAVAVPAEMNAEFIATCAGTLATTDVGQDFDLSSALTVNRAGTTYKVVRCAGFIATNSGRFNLISSETYPQVGK